MKKLCTFVFTALISTAFSQLFTKYDFNGNYIDLTGNGFNGTPNGTTFTVDRHGNANAAVNFNGSSDYIDCGGIGLNSTYLTISMWTRRPSYDGGGHCLLGQSSVQTLDNSLNIMMTGLVVAGEEAVGFDLYADGLYDTTGAKDPGWNHWTFTYDYTNYATAIYRNGQLIKSGFLAGAYVGSGSVYLGATGWIADFFAGDLDDIRIWNNILTATQVDSVYQAEKPLCAGSLGLSSVITDVSCHGGSNGSVLVSATTGVTPFTYAWTSGPPTNPGTGFSTGNYTCVVTDAVGCKDSVALFVNEPAQLNISMSFTNTTCNGGMDGAAEALVSGGTIPYNYAWPPFNEFGPTITGYAAGSYTCDIIDNNGCQTTGTVTIGQPGPFTATATSTQITVCQGQIDTLSVVYTGGAGLDHYEWYDYGTSTTYTTTSDTFLLEPVSTPSVIIGCWVYDIFGCSAYTSVSLNINQGDGLDGHVYDAGANPVGSGQVYLFRKKNGIAGPADTTAVLPLSPSGLFSTFSLYNGDYFLKVVADTNVYPNAVGTYYSTSPNAYQWDSAVVIQHYGCTAGGMDTGKDVTIIEIVPQLGAGVITGQITFIPGFGTAFKTGPGPLSPLGAPLKGVDVKLGKNPGGSPAARTTTDSTGYYYFDSIAVGDYKIYVDIPNYGMDSTRGVSITPVDTVSQQNDYFVDSAMVHVLPHYTVTIAAGICAGDSVYAGGGYQTSSGTYTDSLSNGLGGDSLVVTNLIVHPLPTVVANTTADTICLGNSVTLTGSGTASGYFWSGTVVNGLPFSPSVTDTYTVTGIDTNACQNTAAVTVVVESCVGISSTVRASGVSVFPNPAVNKLTVSSSAIPEAIEVRNIAGEKIMDVAVAGNKTGIDISRLAAGVYFVKVSLAKEETRYLKVVKE